MVNLLATMLEDPWGDHQAAVHELFPDGLCAAHVFALSRFSDNVKLQAAGSFQSSFTADRAHALHTWLYHLLGGADAKLLAPPAVDDRMGVKACTYVCDRSKAAAKVFKKERDRLRQTKARGSATADTELDQLRSARTVPYMSWLLPRDAKFEKTSSSGGGGDPTVGSEAERVAATARLLALAMGTHIRLGAGYCSRSEPCGVIRLAGHNDLLGIIASFHRYGHAGKVLHPGAKEVCELRALNWRLEQERHAWRAAAGELESTVVELERELERKERCHTAKLAAERVEWGGLLRAAEEKLELLFEKCKVGECRVWGDGMVDWWCDCEWWLTDCFRPTQAEAKTLKARLTVANKDSKEESQEWQLYVNRLKNDHTNDIRDTIAELREYQQRAGEERDDEAERAVELEQRVTELSAALERVRSTSKAGLLEQLGQLQAKVRELGTRRTLNQRRVSDANLADRRTRVAEEKAAAATAALREYGTTAESERAATERAESLEEELFEVQTVEVQRECSGSVVSIV